MCNGEYDEIVVKDRVKRIDVYEKQLIICYAEKEGCQICEFESVSYTHLDVYKRQL